MRFLSPWRILRRPAGVLLLVLPTCCLVPGAAWAQFPQPSKGRTGAGATRAEPVAPQPAAVKTPAPRPAAEESWWFLTGPDGKKVPVPVALWKRFLQWQTTQQAPAYHVTSVSLEGDLDGDRALLATRVEIRVNRVDEWVPVSLRMQTGNSVLVTTPTYKGSGEARPDTGVADPTAGLRWWLKGRGLHELSFRLSVPVQRQNPGRRIQLALPTPAAAGTRLVLHIPGGPLRVTAADGHGFASARLLNGNRTRIENHGLGDRVDLSWRSVAATEPEDVVLTSVAAIAVELNTESVVLKAQQRVRILKGQPGTITVQLPAGFELIDVQGEAIQEPQVDPDEPRRIHLPLTDPEIDAASEPVDIRWTLQSPFPMQSSPLVIEGFHVEQARYQTGHIAIGQLDNFRTTKKLGRFVHRISIGHLPRTPTVAPLFGDNVASAWEILRQPFRLELDLLKIEPRFVAEPHLFLKLSEKTAELSVDIPRGQVFRGAVEVLEFPWPDWTDQGWQVLSDESPELQFRYDEQREVLQVKLTARRTAEDGRFAVRFRAVRPLAGTESIPLSLPGITTPIPSQPVLIVANAENIETEFTPVDEAAIRPLSARLQDTVSVPVELSELATRSYHLEPTAQAFQVKVLPQPQQITTSSSVITTYEDRRLKVTQQIDYQVAYARLSTVELMIPEALQNRRVRFRLQASSLEKPILLESNWTEVQVGSLKQASIKLDEDRIGTFRILAEFELPVPEVLAIASVPVEVPLVQSSNSSFESTRFELTDTEGINADLDNDIWQSELDLENRPVWRASGSPPTVALTMMRADDATSRGFSVSQAAIITVLDASQRAQSWAWYRIQGDVKALALRFPSRARLTRQPDFAWDGQTLRRDQFRERRGQTGEIEYRLDVSQLAAAANHLLKVDFHQDNTWDTDWVSSEHKLVAPSFPETVHTAETFWQIRLPVGQHLLTGSKRFTPRFDWQWQSFHFQRLPSKRFSRVENWLQVPGSSLSSAGLPPGNTYGFSCFGPPRTLSIRSTSQGVLVLLGAGLALALGLVLLYVPTTRHVLSLLVVVFLISLAAIWYAEPIELLLQPAGLGCALAATAALIHRRLGRHGTIGLLPLPTPVSLMSQPAADLQPAPPDGSREPSTAIHRLEARSLDVAPVTESGVEG